MNYNIGDKVRLDIPDLGYVSGEIYSIKEFNEQTDLFEIKLTPRTYIEEVILLGMLAYNEKCGCDFWSLRKEENGDIISYDNFNYMFVRR